MTSSSSDTSPAHRSHQNPRVLVLENPSGVCLFDSATASDPSDPWRSPSIAAGVCSMSVTLLKLGRDISSGGEGVGDVMTAVFDPSAKISAVHSSRSLKKGTIHRKDLKTLSPNSAATGQQGVGLTLCARGGQHVCVAVLHEREESGEEENRFAQFARGVAARFVGKFGERVEGMRAAFEAVERSEGRSSVSQEDLAPFREFSL